MITFQQRIYGKIVRLLIHYTKPYLHMLSYFLLIARFECIRLYGFIDNSQKQRYLEFTSLAINVFE